MPNEGEECDQGDKPELPRSRENIYLDVLSDERRSRGSRSPSPGASAGSDHGSRPATPRLDTTYQDHDQGSDYEGLRTEEHDHTYTDMNSESEERDGDSEDQRQEANTVFKKGKTDLVSNYRPISLLTIFDKLFEKIVYTRLFNCLSSNNILYEYQFGFRKFHSISMALIDVVDNIFEHLDNRDIGVGICIDLDRDLK